MRLYRNLEMRVPTRRFNPPRAPKRRLPPHIFVRGILFVAVCVRVTLIRSRPGRPAARSVRHLQRELRKEPNWCRSSGSPGRRLIRLGQLASHSMKMVRDSGSERPAKRFTFISLPKMILCDQTVSLFKPISHILSSAGMNTAVRYSS